jgi:hypothetical protein
MTLSNLCLGLVVVCFLDLVKLPSLSIFSSAIKMPIILEVVGGGMQNEII